MIGRWVRVRLARHLPAASWWRNPAVVYGTRRLYTSRGRRSAISPAAIMAIDECACWQTATDFHVKNISDIVDFPLLVKSKTTNRVIRESPEFIILGVKDLVYVEASAEGNTDNKLSIPVSYKPEVSIECKKPKSHIYPTAQDLVSDFPRYVVANAYFSLHHRGVSVKAGDELELMRVEKRCENLRGPVSFLICRLEHREIALPMETRGNFTACADENKYTISEVVNKFPLPQNVKFENLDEMVLNDRVQYSLDEAFSGRVTLQRRYSEEYIIGCPIDSAPTPSMNDSNSDDSGIGCNCPTLGKKVVFINTSSDRQFWLTEGILCDHHESLLNSSRRIFVDKMTDPKVRLSDELRPQNLLKFTLDEVLPPRPAVVKRTSQVPMNIPPVHHSTHGPVPSFSQPNLQYQYPPTMVRSATYDGRPPLVPARGLPHSISSPSPAPSIRPIEGGTLTPPPRDQPLVLHHIIDMAELRQRREKPKPKGLLSKVSKSKFGQRLTGMLHRERRKSHSSSDDNEGGFNEPVHRDIDPSPIMNNKRMTQRNPSYLDESGNDSLSSDDFEHYPGTVDMTDMYELDNRFRHSRRSNQSANYFTEFGKSSLNDSLRRNNLCPPEEKVLNKYLASQQAYASSHHENLNNSSSSHFSTNNPSGEPHHQTLRVNLPPVRRSPSPDTRDGTGRWEERASRFEERNVRSETRTVDMAVLSVQEVTDCVRARGLERIAQILERNQVDGEFFKSLTGTDFQHEPFNASPFEIKQLDRIQMGIKPRV